MPRSSGSCPPFAILEGRSGAQGVESSDATDVLVTDATPPELAGVPADAVAECGAGPPSPAVLVSDACDPNPLLDYSELREDGSCPGAYTLHRTWTAVDRCGNVTSATQVIEVVDTQPPLVQPSEEIVGCLWPPNHAMACIDRDLLAPIVTDACPGAVSWRLVDCESSQPEDALGDGSTEPDCVVAADGEAACLRAERQGPDAAGRVYRLLIVARDACGNESEAIVVGSVRVPHDATGLAGCPLLHRARP